jgi:Lrp/AsnC family transcriptional regulator, regulator for asnA, asnC and gidA
MAEILLDDLDRSIISELEKDGRRAFREIARSLGVSEGTVRARFHRLEEARVVRIAAIVDPVESSGARLALLLLRVTPEVHAEMVEFLRGLRQVSYVSSVLGSADIFLQVLVRDDLALWNFIQNHLRSREGVVHVESMIEVAVHKFWFENTPTFY